MICLQSPSSSLPVSDHKTVYPLNLRMIERRERSDWSAAGSIRGWVADAEGVF
jgi:hypothetical protein